MNNTANTDPFSKVEYDCQKTGPGRWSVTGPEGRRDELIADYMPDAITAYKARIGLEIWSAERNANN